MTDNLQHVTSGCFTQFRFGDVTCGMIVLTEAEIIGMHFFDTGMVRISVPDGKSAMDVQVVVIDIGEMKLNTF